MNEHYNHNGDKTIDKILSGRSDNNIAFNDLRNALIKMGFKERINGDHFIYKKARIPERINIQPDGNMAKGYQVRQVREIVLKYEI